MDGADSYRLRAILVAILVAPILDLTILSGRDSAGWAGSGKANLGVIPARVASKPQTTPPWHDGHGLKSGERHPEIPEHVGDSPSGSWGRVGAVMMISNPPHFPEIKLFSGRLTESELSSVLEIFAAFT